MPYVRAPAEAEIGSEIQQLCRDIAAEFGNGMLPFFRALAGRPDIMVHLWGVSRAILLSGLLPANTKRMVGLVVARALRSDYFMNVQIEALRRSGVGDDVINSLLDEQREIAGQDSKTNAILQFAREAGRYSESFRREKTAGLKEAGLSDDEILEVTATVGLFASSCQIERTLGIGAPG